MTEEHKRKPQPWASEELMAVELHRKIEKKKDYRPFVNFLNDHEKSDILFIQEWVMAPPKMGIKTGDYRDRDDKITGYCTRTNTWAKDQLYKKGYDCFETESGNPSEGSCIAYKRGKFTIKEVKTNGDSNYWAFCGKAGRTWSAILIEPNNGIKPFVCMNIHAPSTADARTKNSKITSYQDTYDSFESDYYPNKYDLGSSELEKRNRYNTYPHSIIEEFLKMVISGLQPYEHISELIRKCDYRIIIGGDWNDQPLKTQSQRENIQDILPRTVIF